MNIKVVTTMNISLEGEDVNNFKSAIKKLVKDQIGFNTKGITDDEKKILKDISDKF
jgi:hypothetical protein